MRLGHEDGAGQLLLWESLFRKEQEERRSINLYVNISPRNRDWGWDRMRCYLCFLLLNLLLLLGNILPLNLLFPLGLFLPLEPRPRMRCYLFSMCKFFAFSSLAFCCP